MAQFIPMAMAIVAGGLKANAQNNAGIAANQQYKSQVVQEQDSMRQREITRRRDLLRALSSQNAQAGAQGVSMTGGKAAIAKGDIRDAGNDLLIDKVNTKRKIGQLTTAGRNAQRAGEMAAITTLFETAGSAASLKPGG